MTINDRISKLFYDCVLLRHELETELTKRQADAEALEDAALAASRLACAADEDMSVPLDDVNQLYDEYEEAEHKAKDSREIADYVEDLIAKLNAFEDAVMFDFLK